MDCFVARSKAKGYISSEKGGWGISNVIHNDEENTHYYT
jgi:hypothetical protein